MLNDIRFFVGIAVFGYSFKDTYYLQMVADEMLFENVKGVQKLADYFINEIKVIADSATV